MPEDFRLYSNWVGHPSGNPYPETAELIEEGAEVHPPGEAHFELEGVPIGSLGFLSEGPFKVRAEMRSGKNAAWSPAPVLRQKTFSTWTPPIWRRVRSLASDQLREGELAPLLRGGRSTVSFTEHNEGENATNYGRVFAVEPAPRFLRIVVTEGDAPVYLDLKGHRVSEKEKAPAPRPETPDFAPDPFTGPNGTAGLLAGPFSNAVKNAIMEADGEPAPTNQGEWGRGPGGRPVRVEKLKNPYEGRATLKVQAHADADPAEVEAAMGWEMLERMDMDTVWLHVVLLEHASAPHRRGDRSVMKIPRRRVENALGIRRNRNMTVRERAERVKKHVEALQSLNVQFQGVRRHGDKLHFEGDMTASPLWFVQMKAKGQKDLFTGEVTADWYIQAKEGVWGSEFLHNHGDQWTPLPKEWFDQIDRRGKDWTQRLAVALLFLFRINSKNGGVVKLRAEKMLDICGTDMKGSSRRRTERKRRLSKALDALRERFNIGVHAERVHIDNTSGISHADWKARRATFHPPDEMSGELFRNEDDGRPPLPEVKGGDWTAAQIKRLRTDLGDTQSEFAEKLGVSRQMVSRYENRHDPPSDDVRKTLDRLDSRFR